MATEKEMLKYINMARQFPHYFIALIDQQLDLFINQKEIAIAPEIIYETNQGKTAWIEARQFLQTQSTLPPFQWHEGLAKAAKQHVTDLCLHDMFGHSGSDGSSFSERILAHCKKGQGAMAQIIGPDFLIQGRNTAEMTVLGLVVDDGVKDRGHRKTIFNCNYKCIGCCSQLQKDKVVTVFNLTERNLSLREQSSLPNSQKEILSHTSPNFKENHRPSELKQEPVSSKADYLSATEPTTFKKESRGSLKYAPLKDSTNREGASQMSKGGKVVREKIENIRTFTDGDCQITEKVTRTVYRDGTSQENIEKRTVYIE